MNPVTRAFRTLSTWFGGATTYVDVGTHRPVPLDTGSDCAPSSWQRGASIPALLRCCALYADQLATLPRAVVRRDANGAVERDSTSDSARALAATSYLDWEGAVLACCLTGNGYLRIRRNDRGGPSVLEWIPSARVAVETDDRRRLWYRTARDYALAEDEELIAATDMVHLRFRMAAGNRVMGTSPAMLCASTLALALDARQLHGELLANLSVPSFVMSASGKISGETLARLKSEWDASFGKRTGGRFRTGFVDQGMKPEGIPLGDAMKAQMIESFRFSVEEVGRMYGVPAVLLDEPGAQTSANATEGMRAFASTALGPFAARVADELTRKLVADGAWRVEFDLRDLLQSPAEQADRTVRYLNAGALNLNEVRSLLGLAPIAGGDVVRCPVNCAPLDRWLTGMPPPVQEPAHEDVPAVEDPDAGDAAQQRRLRAV